MEEGEADTEIVYRLILFSWYSEDTRRTNPKGMAYMSNSMMSFEISGGVHKFSKPKT